MIPSIGRIVHYVLPSGHHNAGEHRPAIIVRVWDQKPNEQSCVQLQVFMDGSNDSPDERGEEVGSVVWRTSVGQDPEGKLPGTFHEPERI